MMLTWLILRSCMVSIMYLARCITAYARGRHGCVADTGEEAHLDFCHSPLILFLQKEVNRAGPRAWNRSIAGMGKSVHLIAHP
jgi:hypothetical protein